MYLCYIQLDAHANHSWRTVPCYTLHSTLPSLLSLLLVNCGTSNELLACIEFCYGIFVCCRAQARASLSRQSLVCIEFHWFMFHMRDESEREAAKGGRERERVPQLPQGFESETLEDSVARLRSGDNAVITSFEYFTLSFPHFRFVSSSSLLRAGIIMAKKDMPLPHSQCLCLWHCLCYCLPLFANSPMPLCLQ